MTKKSTNASKSTTSDPVVESPTVVDPPLAAKCDDLKPADDKAEFLALLGEYNHASDKCIELVLKKAQRLAKCSPTVQLAALLLKVDNFSDE